MLSDFPGVLQNLLGTYILSSQGPGWTNPSRGLLLETVLSKAKTNIVINCGQAGPAKRILMEALLFGRWGDKTLRGWAQGRSFLFIFQPLFIAVIVLLCKCS